MAGPDLPAGAGDQQLRSGIEALGLHMEEERLALLKAFLALLWKWNQRFNLTGAGSMDELVASHVLDSLSIAGFVHGQQVLDVGTGAGFPGVPLALLEPERKFTLLDSNGKKTRFLFQASTELGLENVNIERCRVEHYRPPTGVDCLVTRAVGEVGSVGARALPCVRPGGFMVFMKGSEYRAEIERLPEGLELEAVHSLAVPGKTLPRQVVILRKTEALLS